MANGMGGIGTFVGRSDELRWIEAASAAVAGTGRGRLVTVIGDAGIGKTRFCEECAGRAGAAGLAVHWGRCWTDGGAPPLWPWQSILAGLGGPGAAALLDGDAGRDAVDPERFARFVAVAERLAAAGARSPVCLVLDDVHAADPGALLLTRFIVSALDRLPLLLLIARRPAGPAGDPVAARLLAELEAAGATLVLRGLDLEETGRLVSAWGGDLDDGLLSAVHGITRGSPLVLRRLLERGAPLSDRTLPDGLQAAVADALRGFGPAAARVLELAAVAGHSVSIPEAAVLTGASPARVLEVVAQARRSGLVDEEGPRAFAFSHDLVREALAARLSAAERLDAHAAVAAALEGAGPDGAEDRLARRAHHAVAASARSPADALRAVAACQDAARFMTRRFAYERAASLLATAVGLAEEAGGPPRASLLLERARATLLCGRLAEARAQFDVAARAADREGVPVLLAHAAIGLGGVWANEHRDPVERERVLALQRRALEGLPEEEAVLRGRLGVRLTAEAVFQGGPLEAVFEAVRAVRRLGDGSALAEGLSLLHHALLAAEFTGLCMAVADELIAVASAAGEGLLALMGLCLRAVDLFQLGDAGAERALADLRARADALGCRSILFVVGALDVMRLLRAGRLDEAETEAERCLRLGTEVGDADALAYYGAHLVAIRWLQGREAEILGVVEEVAASPTLTPGEFVYPATLAFLAANAGQEDRARQALGRVVAPGLAALPRSSTWLTGMCAIAVAASTLGDAGVAARAYEQLLPFAGRPVMPSLAIVCFGSVERVLGLAALAWDDVAAAAGHLERAVAANVRLGNRPLAACARAELAHVLLRRGTPGDAEDAAKLLGEAVREAESMAMARRAAAWAETLGRLRDDAASAADVVRRDGPRWRVEVAGRGVLVEDLVGMAYIARLMETPGREVPALWLVSGEEVPGAGTLPQAVLDDQARAEYAGRLRELGADLDEARANADLGTAERLQAELDVLTSELAGAIGLRGRSRSFSQPEERARTAVRKAIARALDAVAASDPEVAATLRARIRTGYRCSYAV